MVKLFTKNSELLHVFCFNRNITNLGFLRILQIINMKVSLRFFKSPIFSILSLFLLTAVLSTPRFVQEESENSTRIAALFFVDFGFTRDPDEVYSRQDSFQHWTPKKLNLNEKAQGTVWFMLDLPESSKKRVIEVRNFKILSFEAFLKSGTSEIIAIE